MPPTHRPPRPLAVLADDVETCPETILIHSREAPATIIPFDRTPTTDSEAS